MIKEVWAPRVNLNDEDARIAQWLFESASPVTLGQAFVVLETNKTAQEVEAESAGFLYYRRPSDSTIATGDLLAVISTQPLSSEEQERALAGNRGAPVAESAHGGERQVSAKALKLLQAHGLGIEDIPGTERVTVAVATAVIASREAAPGVPDYLKEIESTRVKAQEVAALTASYHQMVLSEVTVPLDFHRSAAALARATQEHEFPFTLGDLACYGCSRLLARYPQLNGCFHNGRQYRHQHVNVGYALNIGKGLRVPVIRNADEMSLPDVAQFLRDYILQYSEDRLTNRDCSGGSFTITDLSASNVLTFRPVVSPMQSAILGIGKHEESKQVLLILAFDHRVADGLIAAQFLNELRTFMEAPAAVQAPPVAELEEAGQTGLKKALLEYQAGRLSYESLQQRLSSVSRVSAYPLSEVQKGFWVLQKIAPTAYNVTMCYRVRGPLDEATLRQAADHLLKQHPILGNAIVERNGVLLQVERVRQLDVRVVDVAESDDTALAKRAREIAKQPFDLERGPLIRMDLINREARDHVVLITIHHIICDGASCRMMMEHLLANYRALIDRRALPASRTETYRDFVFWEREWLNGSAATQAEKYWLRELAGPLPVLKLPTDRSPAAAGFGTGGDTHATLLAREAIQGLRVFSRQNNLKLSTVYLGLFKLLLHYCGGQSDLIVGMPVTTRTQVQFKNVFGCFINMIAVRSTLQPEQSFREYLAQLQRTVATGLYHGNFPFARVVKLLDVGRNERYAPIFQVAFIYQDVPEALSVPESTSWEPFGNLTQEGQYELTLEVIETDDLPVFYWKYDPDVLEESTIARMATMFASLAQLVTEGAEPHAHTLPQQLRNWSAEWVRKANLANDEPVPAEPESPATREEESRDIAELKRTVAAIWKDVLKLQAVDEDRGFFQAGGNSVSAVLVAAQISKAFGCRFTITLLFRHPTINKIVGYLRQQRGGRSSDAPPRVTERRVRTRDTLSTPDYYDTSLAIVGMSCEMPGARDHREYWSNLLNAVESAEFLSSAQLRARGAADQLLNDETYVPARSSMEGKDEFDAEFFNVTATSAALMDAQQRLLLQHAWRAVEDAGYVPETIPSTSVIVTANNAGYHASLHAAQQVSSNAGPLTNYMLAQGGTIATSISYHLGLKGASIFVHSNCSSSLVALHSAWQYLRMKDSKYALVGAASIYSRDRIGYFHQPGSMFSSDGHCRAFDAAASGMTIGEGAGAVLLKRVRDAIEDGDHIYAIIRGIGVNNDGSDKAGFHAPSVSGQSELISDVLKASGVSARSIQYVETSAAGSLFGDAIEVMALENAFRAHTDDLQFCAIGSVKPNIGHLDSAAGLAGLIKVALSLQHGKVPPSINFSTPNPEIGFERSPFYIATACESFTTGQTPHRAALSSLGIGGTNAHAILEAAPSRRVEVDETFTGPHLVPISAKRAERLQEYASRLLEFLIETPECSLPSLAFTFQSGRTAFAHRAAFVVSSIAELVECLRHFVSTQGSGMAQIHCGGPASPDARSWLEQEDADQLVRGWIADRQLHKLAKCWVSGVDVQWKLLYGNAPPLRGSFPTYPFAKERYWLGELPDPLARVDKPSIAVTVPPPVTGPEKAHACLRQAIAAVKGCEVGDVDVTLAFFELGLTSYELLQVIKKVSDVLGERISPLTPLQYPTFRELADYLYRAHPEKFAALPGHDRPTGDEGAEPDIMRDFRSGKVSIESILALVTEAGIA